MQKRLELLKAQAIGWLKLPITNKSLSNASHCITLIDNALKRQKITPRILTAGSLIQQGGNGYTQNLILFGMLWNDVCESYRGTDTMPPTSTEFLNTLKALGYAQLVNSKGITKKIEFKGASSLQTVWVRQGMGCEFTTIKNINRELATSIPQSPKNAPK